MNNQHTPVISFVAKSGTGKTTLIERIIPLLKARGYKLGVIKHDAHRFEIDIPGKDTWRMTQAGADSVLISSSEKAALIERVEVEKNLDELIAMLPEVDLILTEGFKGNDKVKIEVSRSEVSTELLSKPQELLAIASDISWDLGVPCYNIDDAQGIVNEIIKYASEYAKN